MARNTRTFSDINLLFGIHPATGDVLKKINEEAVKASVRNLIQTANFERPFHPEIGCQIGSLLFENLTPVLIQVMKRTIFDVIDKFEPRVRVVDVRIRDNLDNNEIAVDVEFIINNSERPVTITTSLTRIR